MHTKLDLRFNHLKTKTIWLSSRNYLITLANSILQEKKSQLNPNANIFSMYGGQQEGFNQQADFDQRQGGRKDYGQDGYQGRRKLSSFIEITRLKTDFPLIACVHNT